MKVIVKVVPRSSKTEISEWLGEALKLHVQEPFEKGKVNQSIRSLLSNTLNLPIEKIQITSGVSSMYKTIQLQGLNKIEMREKLV